MFLVCLDEGPTKQLGFSVTMNYFDLCIRNRELHSLQWTTGCWWCLKYQSTCPWYVVVVMMLFLSDGLLPSTQSANHCFSDLVNCEFPFNLMQNPVWLDYTHRKEPYLGPILYHNVQLIYSVNNTIDVIFDIFFELIEWFICLNFWSFSIKFETVIKCMLNEAFQKQ